MSAPHATQVYLTITADGAAATPRARACGSANSKGWPTNSSSRSMFTTCRPAPASGTRSSIWNKIEHRLFSFISMNWRAKPLVSYRVIVDLISATTTDTGLTVRCELDTGRYPKGIAVTDQEMAEINIHRANFHGEWNYTIKPNERRSDRLVDT